MQHQTVVIGSGVAAAALTHRILERDPGHSILILEAGPRVPSRDRRAWWYLVIHDRAPYDHCHDLPLAGPNGAPFENESTGATSWVFQGSRMMGFGGSTYHWGGWGLRFKPEDFNLRTLTGRGANWPFGYEEMEQHYCDAEALLGVSGSDPHGWTPRSKDYPLPAFEHTAADAPMIDAFKKLGITYAPMPMARYRKCMTTGTCKYCPIGARFVAAYLLDELVDSGRYSNLTMQVCCPVTELIPDGKDRIAGVRYFDREKKEIREAHGERFVICSGSYESPKLLLRSKNDFWEHGVGNDHKLVGKHIISHPFLYVRGWSQKNPDRLQQELDFPTLMSRHYDTTREQRDGKLFLFRDRTKPRVNLAKLMSEGRTREQIEAHITGPMEWELQGFMEEFANPENRVELGTGDNRLGLPQTRVHFHRADGFDAAAEERLGWMKLILREMGLTVGTQPEKDFGVLTQRGDHAASTCRMADSPEEGVVDRDLKVHGVKNLFVCSNAVFPSGAAVNPTLTVTALSLRLGQHLTPAPADGKGGRP
jgi:choline dehydrogenase-like flavoprotein